VFNPWPSYFQLAQATWDANVVVAMRLMRLASGGALAQREVQRMVTEKCLTFAQAQMTAATKTIAGVGISGATKSASDVYRRKVRSNRRRLAR
jgi:energy-converting hydrogenase Eha subunit H